MNDHSCYTSEIRSINNFVVFFDETSHYFLCKSLNCLREELIIQLEALTSFIGLKFFVYPRDQRGENTRLCLQPDLNIDREGFPSDSNIFQRYGKLQEELENHCNKAFEKYKEYRLEIKRLLII